MTKCNIPNGLFQSVKSRKFNIDFNGGNISSDGGILPLSEMDKHLGITAQVAAALKPFDQRQPGKVKHDYLPMLRQRVYGIVNGNEDLNDHNSLRSDELLQTVCGKDKTLAGASTLSRFENSSGREECIAVSKVFVEIFINSFKVPPRELVFDFDATDDPVHGMQEGRFFHGYYDHYCFLPLYVFCEQQLLVSYLRPANIDGAKHSWAILSLLVKRFREEWPEVKIIFRADSGFCRWKMLRWCEKNEVKYIVGISRNKRLEKLSSHLARKAEKQYNRTGKKAKLYCDLYYAAKPWDKRRRIIAKSEHNSQGPNRRYVVTNIKAPGKYLYEKVYCARGDMENRIKEQQLDLFADRTSCHDWWANQFRLLLSSLAYTLIERFRALALKNTQFVKAQCGTIRLKLLKIGAVIRRNTRKIYVSLSSAYPYKNEFIAICENIAALA
jgi:hypothetical protein